jgi:predicted nuclease with TOPRIM domain
MIFCFQTLSRYSYISCCHANVSGEPTSVFGLARKSRCDELQKQNDELKAYMNVLTGQVDALRREVAELRKETKAFRRRISQLREETTSLRVQKQGLEDSVEILTKEREVFQKTIQNLWQAAKKRKQTDLPTSEGVRLV